MRSVTIMSGSISLALLSMAICVASGTSVAAEVTRGYALASACMACHGPSGDSPGSIPSLHDKTADYIADRLKAFKDGSAASTVMGGLAKGYSEEEIAEIAGYIAALPE
jgi:sulfide dehydrogenase cytochrome subunit